MSSVFSGSWRYGKWKTFVKIDWWIFRNVGIDSTYAISISMAVASSFRSLKLMRSSPTEYRFLPIFFIVFIASGTVK